MPAPEQARAHQRRPFLGVPGRAAVVRLLRSAYGRALGLDPSARVLRRRLLTAPVAPVRIVCIYRCANAARVRTLVDDRPPDAQVALWGLDGVADELAEWTVGSGPGDRGAHVNALVRHLGGPAGRLVICDDDVELPADGLAALAGASAAAGLDLAQPAHSPRSSVSWRFTRRRPLLLARSTGFVEIGPVVVMSAAASARLLPLPEDDGMSWGLEAAWAQHRPPLRFGIVDAVPVRHLAPVGATYDGGREARRRDSSLRAFDTSIAELQVVYGRWRPWQRTAPWLTNT